MSQRLTIDKGIATSRFIKQNQVYIIPNSRFILVVAIAAPQGEGRNDLSGQFMTQLARQLDSTVCQVPDTLRKHPVLLLPAAFYIQVDTHC